jgi:hypothetical protein
VHFYLLEVTSSEVTVSCMEISTLISYLLFGCSLFEVIVFGDTLRMWDIAGFMVCLTASYFYMLEVRRQEAEEKAMGGAVAAV